MASAEGALLAAKRIVERAEERFVPSRLSSHFTIASADSEQQLTAVLREHGIDARVELVELPSIPRGVGGKANRDLLKSALEAAQAAARSS